MPFAGALPLLPDNTLVDDPFVVYQSEKEQGLLKSLISGL